MMGLTAGIGAGIVGLFESCRLEGFEAGWNWMMGLTAGIGAGIVGLFDSCRLEGFEAG